MCLCWNHGCGKACSYAVEIAGMSPCSWPALNGSGNIEFAQCLGVFQQIWQTHLPLPPRGASVSGKASTHKNSTFHFHPSRADARMRGFRFRQV